MGERERLIELINKGEQSMWGKSVGGIKEQREMLADYLLDNGVIVPHAKIGESIYYLDFEINADKTGLESKIHRTTVAEISIINTYTMYSTRCEKSFLGSMFGREVFLTKEEAEKALKGGATND